MADAHGEMERDDLKKTRWAMAHLMWAAGCTWGKSASPQKFMKMLTPQKTYQGRTPREQREEWERDLAILDGIGLKEGNGNGS